MFYCILKSTGISTFKDMTLHYGVAFSVLSGMATYLSCVLRLTTLSCAWLTLWCLTSGILVMHCDPEHTKCQVQVTAFNGLCYADLV
jgi:hypothetical protein